MSEKKVTRKTLARYAALLGPNSLSADALRFYDELKGAGSKPSILMRNSGFSIKTKEGTFHYG